MAEARSSLHHQIMKPTNSKPEKLHSKQTNTDTVERLRATRSNFDQAICWKESASKLSVHHVPPDSCAVFPLDRLRLVTSCCRLFGSFGSRHSFVTLLLGSWISQPSLCGRLPQQGIEDGRWKPKRRWSSRCMLLLCTELRWARWSFLSEIHSRRQPALWPLLTLDFRCLTSCGSHVIGAVWVLAGSAQPQQSTFLSLNCGVESNFWTVD